MRTAKRQAASLIDKRDFVPRGYQLYLLRDTIGFQVADGGHRATTAPSKPPKSATATDPTPNAASPLPLSHPGHTMKGTVHHGPSTANRQLVLRALRTGSRYAQRSALTA